MNTLYEFRINKKAITKKRNNDPSAVPVIDVFEKDKKLFQIGLNQPHSASEAAFETLMGRDSIELFDEIPYAELLNELLEPLYTDESISTLSFLRKYHFHIHTTDIPLIQFLDEESRLQYIRRIMQQPFDANRQVYAADLYDVIGRIDVQFKEQSSKLGMERSGISDILTDITGDAVGMTYFFSIFPDEGMCILIEELGKKLQTHVRKTRSAKGHLDTIVKQIAELEKHAVNTQNLKKAVEETQIKLPYTIVQSKIRRAYTESRNLQTSAEIAPRTQYGLVRRLHTTLHARTNKKYNPQIKTYAFTEPYNRYMNRIQIAKSI